MYIDLAIIGRLIHASIGYIYIGVVYLVTIRYHIIILYFCLYEHLFYAFSIYLSIRSEERKTPVWPPHVPPDEPPPLPPSPATADDIKPRPPSPWMVPWQSVRCSLVSGSFCRRRRSGS